MSLLFHDYGGHAFTAQLARAMARRGHEVNYVSFGEFATPKGRVEASDGDPPGFRAEVLSIGEPFDKDNLLRRRRQQQKYARLAAARVREHRPRVVISSNSPLEVQDALQRACRATGAKFVFWMQDVHSEAIGRILSRRNALLGSLARRYYLALEKRLLGRSDHVVVIAEDFVGLIGPGGWGLDAGRISVVENWAPLEDIPLHPRDNDWARRNFRPGRRRIVYAGTLARKHNPEILVQLARRLDADVYLFSEGSGADYVRGRAGQLRLDNLFVRPWVPVDDLPKLLAGADILSAFIEPDAGAFSVPSKVLAYLAAGRPILASIPCQNLAARTIIRAEAGLVSEPGDDEAMVRNAERLLADEGLRERLGRNGRAHADRNFDIGAIAGRFRTLVGDLRQTPQDECRNIRDLGAL